VRSITLISLLLFASVTTYAADGVSQVSSQEERDSVAQRIHNVETGFPSILLRGHAPLTFDLRKLMELYRVPGVSIAVINEFKIDWSKGYGVVENGKNTPVTVNTIFQAGSISKPVAAAGALSLVQEGKLSLDEDVNRKLIAWRVPENEFTKKEKVTLRRLLSHSAGINVHGFLGYRADEPVPDLIQVLNGTKPANTLPIRVDALPGAAYRYSGGGFTVAQQLLIDGAGEQFPRLMRELVFNKEGMSESTYEEPLPSSWVPRAASGTDTCGNTIPGGRYIYPEMAAAGLWTTATDLAKFAIDIALSTRGESNRVLTRGMAQEMLTPQIADIGLGFHLGVKKNPGEFRHGGSDEGFEAELIMNSNSGQGVVILTNSQNGSALAEFLIDRVAKEYKWNYAAPRYSAVNLLRVVENASGAESALTAYSEIKTGELAGYELRDDSLTQLGQEMLECNRVNDAVVVLKRDVVEHPTAWQSYEGLADAYRRAGETALAIRNYETSLHLNPSNQDAVKNLRKLKREP
jgi:CubicO group peptidase (beta-lactamase class C family)